MVKAPTLLHRVRGEGYFNPKSLRVTKVEVGLAALIAIITSSPSRDIPLRSSDRRRIEENPGVEHIGVGGGGGGK